MRFQKLTIDNYKSYGSRVEFDFSPRNDDPARTVYLVGGMNGSGKTALLEALNICVHGAKPRTIAQALNRRQRAMGRLECTIELEILEDDGNAICITRSWRATGRSRSADSIDGDLYLESYVNVKRSGAIVCSDPKLCQDLIYAMFPRGITQFFFFDGEKIQEMASDEHSELRLKASMEAALGFEQVNRLIADLSTLRDRERRDHTEISDADIRSKESHIEALKLKRNSLVAEQEELEADIRDFTAKQKNAENRLEALFGTQIGDRNDHKRLRKELQSHVAEQGDIEGQIRVWVERLIPIALLQVHADTVTKLLKRAQVRSDWSAIHGNADALAEAICEYLLSQLSTEIGSLAGQASRLKYLIRNAIDRFIASSNYEIEGDDLLELPPLQASRIEEQLIEGRNAEFDEFLKLLQRREILAGCIADLESRLDKTQSESEEHELLIQLQGEASSYASQTGKKRNDLARVVDRLNDLDRDIQSAQRDLDILYEKFVQSQDLKKLLERISKLRLLLNEYIEALRIAKIEQLKNHTLHMFKQLATKGDLISEVNIDRDTFALSILDRVGSTILKQNLSAGEKEVFAVSLLWGLAKTSELNMPVVIDTPLSRLDSVHRDNIVKKYFPTAGHQVIVLSTDTEVDHEYYELLRPHLQVAFKLVFSNEDERTCVEEGYFWENA